MVDSFDGLKIGMLVSEAWLNGGTVNSEAIGKEYDLKLRIDLTPQSSSVRNMGASDDTSVFEVVQTYKQTTEAKIDIIDSVLDNIKLDSASIKANQTNATQASKFVDELGVAYGVKHINNKPRVSSMPYTYDIAEGNVANHIAFSKEVG